jgi:hypothetical protein
MSTEILHEKDPKTVRSAGDLSRRKMLLTGTSVLTAAGLQSGTVGLIPPAQAQQNAPARTVTFSSEELTQRTTARRAVEAAIWGMPIVNFDGLLPRHE